jgi:hypothetical protein
MKKIAVGIIAILGVTLLQPAYAQDKKSIVIIDTAIDTSLPELQGKIVYEVCILDETRCPNGKFFQEGPGSATLPAPQVSSNGFEHGTQMALVANKVNPDMNIVFIRIFSVEPKTGKAFGATANSTVKQALDWVATNKTKFNIVAVSASVGHNPTKTGAGYCKLDRFDNNLKKSIANLKSIGIASVFAAGNNSDPVTKSGDKTRINYPACLTDSVAISSFNTRGESVPSANDSAEVDFYALGTYEFTSRNIAGTSAATAGFAAYWVKNYNGSFDSTYNYFKSIATVSDTKKSNTVVDILK